MKRKILLPLIVFCVVTLTLSAVSVDAETYGNLTYSVSNGEVTITGYTGSPTTIEIPSAIDDLPVSGIGDSAFSRCFSLISITIPYGVTSIGNAAFMGCSSLTSITIPDSVTFIDVDAFYGCVGLKEVHISSIEAWCNITFGWGSHPFYGRYDNGCNLYLNDELITDLEIPDGITRINFCAFMGCSSLTSISIPDSVTEIGNYAFSGCSNLTSITIPDSVTMISASAFGSTAYYYDDSNWENNVLYIGNHLIEAKRELSGDCTIRNNTKTIANSAFFSCNNLESIAIPDSVTSIGYNAFYECNGLSDVFYNGGVHQWNAIKIEEGNDELKNAEIHYNYKYPQNVSGVFQFASGKGSASFTYKDDYFSSDSYSYKSSLARMSMCLALSAFAKHESGNKYGNQYANVKDLMEKIGFKDFDKNDWYKKTPEKDSIGVAVGRKLVTYPEGDYTILAIAIRGGGYENEWGGNFSVGDGETHKGFAVARDQVLDFVERYVQNYKISGNVKLWITGYSRAAATANLVAAHYDEYPYALNNNIVLAPENIYAYCFEPPAPTSDTDRNNSLYNNIFNIVNQHDFVPMVVMNKWNYGRYGITKYLPSAQTNSNYIELRRVMKQYLKKYLDDEYIVDNFVYYYPTTSLITGIDKGLFNGQGVFLDRTMDKLAKAVGNPTRYKNEYQEAFEYIGENIIGKGKAEEFSNSFISEMEKNSFLLTAESSLTSVCALNPAFWINGTISGSASYLTLRRIVKNSFKNIGISITNDAVDSIAGLIIDIGIDGAVTLLKNTKSIKQGHFPEVCLAWLDIVGDNDFTNQRLRTLYLNCPVDMEIYDSTDNLVAKITDNVPQEIEGSSIVTFVDENGQKIVYLPEDEEYSIRVIATDNGEVTYSIQESNQETGEVKTVNYTGIAVQKDQILNGKAENLNLTEDAVYPLQKEEEALEAEVITKAVPVEITLDSEGYGNVSGGGIFYTGEYAKAIAIPVENETFLGWYQGETLLSSEEEYRFAVAESTKLTAKFTEQTCEVVFVDNDNCAIATNRILKGDTLEFPQAPIKEGFRFEGYYKDSLYSVPASEEDIYSENTTIYAKYKAECYTQTTVSEDKKEFTVKPINFEKKCIVILALYNGNRFVGMQTALFDGEDLHFTTDIEYTTAKVMAWDNFSAMIPLSKAELIK